MNNGVIYDGVKAFSLRELSDRGWTIEGQSESDIEQLVTEAAWMYAVIQKRAGGVVSIPRVLMKGETDVEEDSLPFEFDIPDLMHRSSVATDTYAQAYGLTVKNQFKDLRVRWFRPDSVELVLDEELGLVRFERQLTRGKHVYQYDPKTDTSPDGLWWIWQTGMPEVGPGIPKADVAAGPAMLLRAIDALGIKYFSQGAIGQIYFTSPQPMGESQFDKFKKWFRRLYQGGLDTAYQRAMVLETGFEPHSLSADPKDLMMSELDEDNRRDICAVFDTPEPLITGDAGGMSRATMNVLIAAWINGTIMTQAQLIVDAFNHHILEPAGYKLLLNPQGMAVNQEEERQRALAFSMYINAGMDPETAAYFLGLEVPEGFELMAEKDDQILIPGGGAPPSGGPGDMEDEPEDEPEDDDDKSVELGRCRQFYRNSHKEQRPIGEGGKRSRRHLDRDFHSDILTPIEIYGIKYEEDAKASMHDLNVIRQDLLDRGVSYQDLISEIRKNSEQTQQEDVAGTMPPFTSTPPSKAPSNWATRRLTRNSKSTTTSSKSLPTGQDDEQ